MNIESIILILATLSTGMMAGIFFTWSNAVAPGIGKLTDIEYLRSLQSMNRVILNTAFRILFVGAVITVALLPVFYYNTASLSLFCIMIIAAVIYWIGVFGVTFLGNMPLNRMLENAKLNSISREVTRDLRIGIETKWNSLNLIRSISSGISFLLLIITLLYIGKI